MKQLFLKKTSKLIKWRETFLNLNVDKSFVLMKKEH